MDEMLKIKPPLIFTYGLVLVIISMCAIFIIANAISWTFMAPDEIAAYNSLLVSHYFGTIYNYWEGFFGRVFAVAYMLAEVKIIHTLRLSPWMGTMAARAVNNLPVLCGMFIGMRVLARSAPWWCIVALSALAFAASQSVAGLSAIWGMWLLDQACYYVSSALFFIIIAFLWKFVDEGFRLRHWVIFTLLMAAFLTDHEMNLVMGGAILAAMSAIAVIYPSQQTEYGVIARRRGYLVLLWFIYLVSAALQVFSPSMAFRNSAAPPQVPLYPDAFLLGLSSVATQLRTMMDVFHSPLPLIFVAAIAIGVGWPIDSRTYRRQCLTFVALILSLFIVYIITTFTLTAYIGIVTTSTIPFRYIIFLSTLTAFTLATTGILVGSVTRLQLSNARSATIAWVAITAAAVAVGASPGMHETVNFVSKPSNLNAFRNAFSFPNQPVPISDRDGLAVYARLDRQLRTPNRDGLAVVDETHLFEPGYAKSATNLFMVGPLAQIYHLRDILYVPCQIGPRPDMCNGLGVTPWREEFGFDGHAPLTFPWAGLNGVTTSPEATIAETASAGEHYLVGGPFSKHQQVAVRAEIDIQKPMPHYVALYYFSGDGSAIQFFDLTDAVAGPANEYGAKAMGASVTTRHDGTIRVSAVFVSAGPATSYQIRLQMTDDQMGTLYQGSPGRSLMIGHASFAAIHSGWGDAD